MTIIFAPQDENYKNTQERVVMWNVPYQTSTKLVVSKVRIGNEQLIAEKSERRGKLYGRLLIFSENKQSLVKENYLD